jgi:hypothetical protein
MHDRICNVATLPTLFQPDARRGPIDGRSTGPTLRDIAYRSLQAGRLIVEGVERMPRARGTVQIVAEQVA